MNFLFWLFLFGIVVATLQDFKRREIDNWLNLFLLFSSLFYILIVSIFSGDTKIIFVFAFSLFIMYFISYLLYYARVFAGGDAKLLFAMTALFVGAGFYKTLSNIGFFLVLLMMSGAIYGLLYSSFIYSKNYKKINKEFSKGFENLWIRYSIVAGILFFALSYFDIAFLFLALFLVVFPFLFIFAKALEKISLTRSVSGKILREGDWLAHDVTVGRRIIKYDFQGLTKKDLKLLKHKKNILIKEGMPFAMAFLIAFFGYVFLNGWIAGIFSFLF